MSGLVVDAGPLYASLDEDDAWHKPAVRLLRTHPGPLVVPTLVIAEVAYFAGRRLGARAELLFSQDLAEGHFAVEPVHPTDWLRIAELTAKYVDFPLGMVDASVIACAERLGVTEIATVDRRHFSAVRPRHTASFTLLP
ncbi:PIN domain-containing protein [Streptomyces bambusae]|uniref:type II toxin-antitoxin system VapC family toxin n=1 Tax=Streptomyces bambusae TaxID=1550616 RepID=UPI001D00103A|nr:PIN domain-containing protein [Streptomyces bambusae]MCB5169267.1 PIN domain-containing protein [Streptomyces bambusae]